MTVRQQWSLGLLIALPICVGTMASADPPERWLRVGQALLPSRPPSSSAIATALATLAVKRAAAEPEIVVDWLRRIRSAAWLPEVRIGVDKELGTRETIDPADRARYSSYNLDQLRIDVHLSWRLDRLRFDPEELAANRQSIQMASLRQELALSVVRLYYEWKRLVLESGAVPPTDSDDVRSSLTSENDSSVLRLRLRKEEIVAELGTLCGREEVDRLLDGNLRQVKEAAR